MPDTELVRTWFREHTNGWRSIVNERRGGPFRAGAERPVLARADGDSLSDYSTFAAACAAADADVRRAGHSCSDGCGPWEVFVQPY